MSGDRSSEWETILRQTKAQLQYAAETGVDGLRRARIAPDPAPAASLVERPKSKSSQGGVKTIAYDPRARPSEAAKARRKTKEQQMEEARAASDGCQKCPLHQGRSKIVWGVGNVDTKVVFVGEGPGAEEDRQGIPFVGAAGQLLTKMIECMGWRRDDVYIANTVKCRPPQNRTPEKAEMQACAPYLEEQLKIIRPEIIVALGKPAAERLLGRAVPITRMRGQLHEYLVGGRTVPLLLTFHPSYLLRSPGAKRHSMEDVLLLFEKIGDPRRLD